jgi:hypothetical protein
MTKKIIFRVLTVNCKKACLHLLNMFWGLLDKNLRHFANISSEEIVFLVCNCEKSSVIWRSKIFQSPDEKSSLLHIDILPLRDLWKFELYLIYRLGGDRFCSFEKVFLLTYCDYWCRYQKPYVMYYFTKLRIDPQISIFGFSQKRSVFKIYHREYVKSARYTVYHISCLHVCYTKLESLHFTYR